MTKLYVAYFINTGLLIVATNTDMTWMGLPTDLSGQYTNTNRQWTYVVGVPIITIMLINVITLFSTALIGYIVKKAKEIALSWRAIL